MSKTRSTSELNELLWTAVEKGCVEEIRALLKEGAEAYFQREETGTSVLMKAAENGHLEAMDELLFRGAPWNAVDRQYRCAGDYALEAGHQKCVDRIVNAGVMTEILLARMASKQKTKTKAQPMIVRPSTPANFVSNAGKSPNVVVNAKYLSRDVTYTDDGELLLDSEADGVMMEWERPLMEAHADCIASLGPNGREKPKRGADVLNVGFGMGIVDGFLQARSPRSHTIIEAHPQVYAHMINMGWDKKPGVRILHGRWQDCIAQIKDCSFDGIFFDTYGETYAEMSEFHQHLPRILRPGGCYSFFNGLCPDNVIFHGVYCEIAKQELAGLGMTTTFVPCPIEAGDEDVWKNVTRKYFHNSTYYLPICMMSMAGPNMKVVENKLDFSGTREVAANNDALELAKIKRCKKA
jgi:protein arginine N-methyltransferase 2